MSKKEKIVPFEVSLRREYVNDRFTQLFVPGILACILRGALSFPVRAIRAAEMSFYLKTFLITLLEALDTAVPFLLFGLLVGITLPMVFRQKPTEEEKKNVPLACILGIPAVTALSLFGLGLGLRLVQSMEKAGYIVYYTLPDGGATPEEKLFYILISALLPALFWEPFRATMMTRTKGDSYPLAILIPALLFAANHPTFQQMPYLFLSGLLLGWLYLKSGSLWTVLAAHAVSNGVLAAFWSYEKLDLLTGPDLWMIGGAALALILLLFLFLKPFQKHPEEDKPFTPAECLRAVFLTFGIYVLLFVVLFQVGEWHLDKPDLQVPGMEDFDDTPQKQDIMPWSQTPPEAPDGEK